MKIKRVDDFHKYGCSFYGKLVVVDYTEDLKNDPKMETWDAGIAFDYVKKAKLLLQEKGYNVVKVLLFIPEYVVEVD